MRASADKHAHAAYERKRRGARSLKIMEIKRLVMPNARTFSHEAILLKAVEVLTGHVIPKAVLPPQTVKRTEDVVRERERNRRSSEIAAVRELKNWVLQNGLSGYGEPLGELKTLDIAINCLRKPRNQDRSTDEHAGN